MLNRLSNCYALFSKSQGVKYYHVLFPGARELQQNNEKVV